MDDRIKSVLAAVLGLPREQVGVGTSHQNVETWDSVKHMKLALALEEEFGIQFDDEEIVEITSFEQIRSSIARKVSQ